MSKIKVLSKETAELIAAGEVIERPLSVAKELIENAVDSGAHKITVEITGGGISYLRVTDDGCGIPFEEVPTSFMRHATSKIETGADLSNIITLGFRGEALASICAVSKVELFTKETGSDFGAHYTVTGGEEGALERVGCPVGTSIIVRDLFYNIPARLKFLKKDVSEGNAVAGIVRKIALSHPEISFSFIRDNNHDFQTSGDGDLYACIYAVLGRQFAASLTKVDYVLGSIEVSGFISKPLFARANRSFQNFFINGRYIRSFICQNALEEAYKNNIMTGKFPACVLHITLPPSIMDVNAHPVKLDVKFSDEKLIFDSIYFAVKNAILLGNNETDIEIKAPTIDNSTKFDYKSDYKYIIPKIHEDFVEKQTIITQTAFEIPVSEPQIQIVNNPEIKLLGEAFATYIICEYETDLYMIDKHAAHERILFEGLRSKAEPLKCQYTLTETAVTVTDDEMAAITEFSDELSKIGYDFAITGGIITITGIPSILDDSDISDTFTEIVDNLREHKNNPLPEIIDNLYHTIACKAAIKGNRETGREELYSLALRVLFDDSIRYCPHGRPCLFKISQRELERNFKRIV
ncbi:MAG: DNA mismatch repair endonuclease MutL [Ruminococcus sp.]|jgi:DNA mismatch repair protein MutL|nr:DNA mismatch repair endonuclease MutL [Ruminococcus sp.]